jgi:hypothetical protein
MLELDWQLDTELQSKILKTYGEMEVASDQVMDRIDAMIHEKHGQGAAL